MRTGNFSGLNNILKLTYLKSSLIMLNNTGYLHEMFEIIDWQYKSIYILWYTHKDLNYCLTIQRLKKKLGKKRTKSGGQSLGYNMIVLLDIEELT